MLGRRLATPLSRVVPQAMHRAAMHRLPAHNFAGLGHLAARKVFPSMQDRGFNMDHRDPNVMYATTILCVRKGDKVVVIGDGQVTQGSVVVKDTAKKVRRLQNGNVVTGFAGAGLHPFFLALVPPGATVLTIVMAQRWMR